MHAYLFDRHDDGGCCPCPLQVRIWDSASGNLRNIFAGHIGKIYGLSFIGSGTILFSSSKDKTIIEWDLLRSEQRKTLEGGLPARLPAGANARAPACACACARPRAAPPHAPPGACPPARTHTPALLQATLPALSCPPRAAPPPSNRSHERGVVGVPDL